MNKKIILLIAILAIVLIGAGLISLKTDLTKKEAPQKETESFTPDPSLKEIQHESVNFDYTNDFPFSCSAELGMSGRFFGDSFVINSEAQYQKFQSDAAEHFNCKWQESETPKIDFSQKP